MRATLLLGIGILILAAPLAAQTPTSPETEATPAIVLPPDAEFLTFVVSKALRGDILLLDSGKELKLIGVKSPELATPNSSAQYYSKEALRYTTDLLKDKEVKVTFERRKTNSSGQWLGYVWLTDGRLFNVRIIEEGYGVPEDPSRVPNEAIREALVAALRKARVDRAGMWKEAEKASDFVQEGRSSTGPPESGPVEELQAVTAPVGTSPSLRPPVRPGLRPKAENRNPAQAGAGIQPGENVWNRPIFNSVPSQTEQAPADWGYLPAEAPGPRNPHPNASSYFDRRSRRIGKYNLNHGPDGRLRGLTPAGPITGNYVYFENQRVPAERGKR